MHSAGSVEPMKLFVLDLDPYAMKVDPKPKQRHWSNRVRFKARRALDCSILD